VYSSIKGVTVIRSRRMRLKEHVVRMGMRNMKKKILGKPKGRYHSGDLGTGGRIILKWILKRQEWRFRLH